MLIKKIKKIGWSFLRKKYVFLKSYSLFLYNHSDIKPYNEAKLHSYKNKYYGKKAFIICNGPSLTTTDLERIESEGYMSFAANRISAIFPDTSWRPTYYTVTDSAQFWLNPTINQVECAFLPKTSYCNTLKTIASKVYFDIEDNRDLLKNPKFSPDCDRVIYSIGTVTYTLFQIAVYMGFRELYLIGCDNRYHREIKADGSIIIHNEVPNKYAGKDTETNEAANTWEMNVAYDAAKKYADEHGIKILNATRGGYMEIFDRVDFDSLFEDK